MRSFSLFSARSFLGLLFLAFLAIGVLYPLALLVEKALTNEQGKFYGLGNIWDYFATPGLADAFIHTLAMGVLVTVVTLTAAFIIAYALTHTRMAGTRLCRGLTLLPLFVPSIFPSLGLIYLFGNQGIFNEYSEFIPLYGPLGIFLGSFIYTLPHAVLLLTIALRDLNADLYYTARTLGSGPWRRFVTITLPGVRYSLTSAAIIIFILTITDFGVPKVLGGTYSMMATEIFNQVVGLNNFTMGATVSLLLLMPCALAFALDTWARKKQRMHNTQSVSRETLQPARNLIRDSIYTFLAWGLLLLPCLCIFMVIAGAFISFWPYDLELTLANFRFEESAYGISPLWNSLFLALSTTTIGTIFLFSASYIVTRANPGRWFSLPYRFMALLPLGIPGTVLGLSFIFAFNSTQGIAGTFYNGMGILIINCLVHFYTVCHLTMTGSLARLPLSYEDTGKTLGASRPETVVRVIIPLQQATLIDVAFYLFVNTMTTISAVVFLYSADTIPASVAILQLFDTGRLAEASAMGFLILCIALTARLLASGIQALKKTPRKNIG